MNILTKTIADYTVFAVCGEQTNEQGKVSIRVIDFAGETLYNDFVDEAAAIKCAVTDKETFDERNRIVGFSLPNGVRLSVEYNDNNKPTQLTTQFGNTKDIEYYDSGCLKSITSYSTNIKALFYNLNFEDGEVDLDKDVEANNV